jgi:hypothetical protein
MMKQNRHDDRSGTNCTELEQAEAHNLGMSHISSNIFLSDLPRALQKVFHSSFSFASAILNEGTVRPIYPISAAAATAATSQT